MKKRFIMVLLPALFLVAICSTAYAQSFLCGSLYVRAGVYKEAVWANCGSPTARSTLGFDYGGPTGSRKDAVKNERWVYVKGGYAYILNIKGGRVTSIEKARR
jgi:Protein of unknown function (DUF2845)